jgi:hypothetical protein
LVFFNFYKNTNLKKISKTIPVIYSPPFLAAPKKGENVIQNAPIASCLSIF